MAYSYCWCCGDTYITHRKYDSSGSLLWSADHGDDVYSIYYESTNDLIIAGGGLIVEDGNDDYDISVWDSSGTRTRTARSGLAVRNALTPTAWGLHRALLDDSGNIVASGRVSVGMEVVPHQNGGSGKNEIQWVVSSGATGGTFTITYDGQTTSALDYDSTAAEVQTALEALSNLDSTKVSVTGGQLPSRGIIVEFTGVLGETNVSLMTLGLGSLTWDQFTVAKLNSSGVYQWGVRPSGSGINETGAIAINPSNGNVLTGSKNFGASQDLLVEYDSSGSQLFTGNPAGATRQISEVGYYSSGFWAYGQLTTSPTLVDGRADWLFLTYDSSGNVNVPATWTGLVHDSRRGAAMDSNERVILCGPTVNSSGIQYDMLCVDSSDYSISWQLSVSGVTFNRVDIDPTSDEIITGGNTTGADDNIYRYDESDGSSPSVQWTDSHGASPTFVWDVAACDSQSYCICGDRVDTDGVRYGPWPF